MSEVQLFKRLLLQASASVLAGFVLSSAVIAEDSAAPAEEETGSIGVEVTDTTTTDGEEPVTGGIDPICADCGEINPEVVIEPIEPIDPICPDCGDINPEVVIDLIDPNSVVEESGEYPMVTIDPIEMVGEEVVEPEIFDLPQASEGEDLGVLENTAMYETSMTSEAMLGSAAVQRGAAMVEPRGDHGGAATARSQGATPNWVKKLFKVK